MAKMKEKVLVIEDDEYSRDALAHLLAGEGYETQSASDGESGLAKARETHPDVIVLDLNLPGIDGKEVTRRLRRNGPLKDVPILIITGDENHAAQSAVELGADAYLTKPLELSDLLRVIADLKSSTEMLQ